MKKALSGVKSGQPLSKLVQKAFKLALQITESAEENNEAPVSDENDMRQSAGENTYQNLKETGAIAEDAKW